MAGCIVIHEQDNVATVIDEVHPGDDMEIVDTKMRFVGRITARESIPFAHKICLREIRSGGFVIKYGQIIGRAKEDIPCGGYVHVHNVISIEGAERVVSK